MSIINKISDYINRKKNPDAVQPIDDAAQSDAEVVEVAVEQPIDKDKLHEFDTILLRYQQGKAFLDDRIIENHKYYKLRQWDVMNQKNKGKGGAEQIQPQSAWLFNAIANKHADAMDNFPSPNILPREENDRIEAERLTAIIPVVLDQCDFEQTYSDAWWDKLITGTSCYGVFWNKEKLNGLGDIDIKKIDLLNLFWEPGVTDIQDSQYVFHTALVDNKVLESAHPELKNKLGGNAFFAREREHDDTIDNSDKSLVVDVYYKYNDDGQTILHYCKYVGDTVLFATENDPDLRDSGLYNHGKYPFIPDVLFPNADSPAGFGYIDIGKDTQEYIDRISQSILKNTLVNARPRFFARQDAGVNLEDYADFSKDIVKYTGSADDIVPIKTSGLPGVYINVLEGKINELKEITGNRDIQTGGTTSGVTAASAIAAMQEAGSKLSRDSSKASYRHYRQIVLLVVELIRQFYDVSRSFRIVGDDGQQRFEQYNNSGIVPQPMGDVAPDGQVIPEFGVDIQYRLPLFDIEISAQKQSPYSKMAQNELALQLYQLRLFDTNNTDAALMCLDMMDFDRKQAIIQKISNNGTILQMLVQAQQRELQLAQLIDEREGTNLAQQIAAEITGSPLMMGQTVGEADVNLDVAPGEAENTKKARQRTAEMTNPT